MFCKIALLLSLRRLQIILLSSNARIAELSLLRGEFEAWLLCFSEGIFPKDGRRYGFCHGNEAILMVFEKICIFQKLIYLQICILKISMLA